MKSSDSGEHKLDMRLATSNLSLVERGAKERERHSKPNAYDRRITPTEQAAKSLAASVDQMCTAMDLVIGKFQTLIRFLFALTALMIITAFVQVVILLESNADTAASVQQEIARQVDRIPEPPRFDIVPKGDGSASLVIETVEEEQESDPVNPIPDEEPTRPAVPKPKKTTTVELQLNLDSAEVGTEVAELE